MAAPADAYYAQGLALLARAREVNAPVLQALAPVIGRSLAGGGVLHTFGSGHSEIISREIIGRAGGLVCVTGLSDPTGGFVENLVGYGTRLAERHDRAHGLRRGETIIVISNSGKNAAPIEVALVAKQKGLHVVALTCVAMAQTAATIHPGGQKLHEVADHVLDNCGTPGDAIVAIPAGADAPPGPAPAMAGPTSTLVGAMLLNLLSLEVIAWLVAHGHPPPLLRSQNLPGAIEHNRELAARYPGRLSRPLA